MCGPFTTGIRLTCSKSPSSAEINNMCPLREGEKFLVVVVDADHYRLAQESATMRQMIATALHSVIIPHLPLFFHPYHTCDLGSKNGQMQKVVSWNRAGRCSLM